MDIIERFSTYLKDALTRSVILATELHNKEVEPLHIFFTLSSQAGSMANEIINRLKIDPKIMEQFLLEFPAIKQTNKKDKQQAELSTMSIKARNVLEKAIMYAHKNKHNYVGTEHLLLSLIEIDDKLISQLFKISNVKKEDIIKNIEAILNNASQFTQIAEISEVIEKMQSSLNNISPIPPASMADQLSRMSSPMNKQNNQTSTLELFATNLTDTKIQKNIDPVIGRKNEIERMIQILCRRNKNNPVLIGEPGTGKTAIVEGLAKKICTGDVPDILLNKKIFAIDMAMLLAGTTFRGEFEARLQQLIEEINHDPNIIVFIDELHNIVGAGSNQGTMDAANILKPVLARGQLRCIGATTPTEFKKYIENDGALERRFQPIIIKQSNVEDTAKILIGIKSNYEKYHNVIITDKAAEEAARLSERYMTNKFLPDKAIDLLDETAASVRIKMKHSTVQKKLIKLEKKLKQITCDKEQAALQDDFEKAVKLKEQEQDLINQIAKTKKIIKPNNKKKVIVTEKDVLNQLAKIINTDVDKLLVQEKNRMHNLERKIGCELIGQNETIKEVVEAIRRSQLQLSNPNRPMASFIFVGNSGVGKTELAKILTKNIYPNQDALIQLNMSEFNESFGVSKLLGSPAGYVGYKESNQFTDKLKMNPYSIILFDEIDKAHKDVSKLLLQILENGEITDATGRKISLKHAIIILTTTTGADQVKKMNIGFGKDKDRTGLKNDIIEKLKEFFTPEVINRIDKVCLFNDLDEKSLEQIANMEVTKLNEQLKKYNTKIKTPQHIIRFLIKQMDRRNTNAREIRNHVRKELENLVAEQILSNNKMQPIYNIVTHNNKVIMNIPNK